MVARLTGLEPATPGVTGRYSNQLSYNRPLRIRLREYLAVLWPSLPPVKRDQAHGCKNLHAKTAIPAKPQQQPDNSI